MFNFRCKENLSEKLADFEQEKEKRKSSADNLDAFLELIASSERDLAELDNSSSSPASNALEKIQVFFPLQTRIKTRISAVMKIISLPL